MRVTIGGTAKVTMRGTMRVAIKIAKSVSIGGTITGYYKNYRWGCLLLAFPRSQFGLNVRRLHATRDP